jgi:D-methionine transport system substrate-binding protein
MQHAIRSVLQWLRQPLALLLFLSAGAATTLAQPLRIGVTPGVLADSVQLAAQLARQQELAVEVIEFTDWTSPNTALDAGDLDLNYFQHQAFLDHAVATGKFRIESVAVGLLPNIGLYSKKIPSLAALQPGARIGIANDPVNQGRGLLLLQAAGLIQLRAGVGSRGSVDDVVGNPSGFRLLEIEGPQLVRAVDDLDLAQGYPAHFVNAGQAEFASRALRYSTLDDLDYAIRFVAHSARKRDPRIARFVQIYQSAPEVRTLIHRSFANDGQLYALPWLSARP